MKLTNFVQLVAISGTFIPGYASAHKCHHDHCFRALNPTGRSGRTSEVSAASAFCAAFTTALVNAPSSFPAYATKACGKKAKHAKHYSSACYCAFPATTTTSLAPTGTPGPCLAGNAVVNGDFEASIVAPPMGWQVRTDQYQGSSNTPYMTNELAYDGHQSAFFKASADSASNGTWAETALTQDIAAVKGSSSTLQFRYRFPSDHSSTGGRLIVRIEGRDYFNVAFGDVAADTWIAQSFDFMVKSGPTAKIAFVARADKGQAITVVVDTVFVPKTAGAKNPCV